TIGTVVAEFKSALPDARVTVYDNNSSDRTAEVALEAGAREGGEAREGKGNTNPGRFAEGDAAGYCLGGGGAPHGAAAPPRMIERLLREQLDMVNGARVETTRDAYRAGHRFGNQALNWVVGLLFEQRGSGPRDLIAS